MKIRAICVDFVSLNLFQNLIISFISNNFHYLKFVKICKICVFLPYKFSIFSINEIAFSFVEANSAGFIFFSKLIIIAIR